jgi:hypothetical protein
MAGPMLHMGEGRFRDRKQLVQVTVGVQGRVQTHPRLGLAPTIPSQPFKSAIPRARHSNVCL